MNKSEYPEDLYKLMGFLEDPQMFESWWTKPVAALDNQTLREVWESGEEGQQKARDFVTAMSANQLG